MSTSHLVRQTFAAVALLLVNFCCWPAEAVIDRSQDSSSADSARVRRLRLIAEFERSEPTKRSPSIQKINYKGKPAYLFKAPCCDQFDNLYDSEGNWLCAPSGGIAGGGSGQCPDAWKAILIPEIEQSKELVTKQ